MFQYSQEVFLHILLLKTTVKNTGYLLKSSKQRLLLYSLCLIFKRVEYEM